MVRAVNWGVGIDECAGPCGRQVTSGDLYSLGSTAWCWEVMQMGAREGGVGGRRERIL